MSTLMEEYLDSVLEQRSLMASPSYSQSTSTAESSVAEYCADYILRAFNKLGSKAKRIKEYLRIDVIRAHKKICRQLYRNPEKYISNPNLDKMYSCYLRNQDSMELLSNGGYGYIGNRYCRNYFLTKTNRKSFYWFITYLFEVYEPEDFCKKFAIRCCGASNSCHTEFCEYKWNKLKVYMLTEWEKELGLAPWFPSQRQDNSAEVIFQSKYEGQEEGVSMCMKRALPSGYALENFTENESMLETVLQEEADEERIRDVEEESLLDSWMDCIEM